MSDENIKLLKELIQNPKIGEILLHYRKINIDQLCKALDLQRENNTPLGQTLIGMGVITEQELMELLIIQSNIGKIVTESYSELEKLQLD